MPFPTQQALVFTELDKQVLQILQPRLQINIPPVGFDPRTASETDLAKYFLPPRPDPVRAPEAFQLWTKAMSPPLSFVDLAADPEEPRLRELFETVSAQAHQLQPTAQGVVQESGDNWSGSFVRPRDFSKMMLVQGAWSVPVPSPPKGLGNGTYASSIWVGLDGNDPASRSLPQMGTGQYVTVTNGVPQRHLFAWWQWWDRNDPLAQQIVIKHKKFPVQAGDAIYVQIEALGPTKVSLLIKNQTSGLTLPMWYGAPPSVNQGLNTIPTHVEGRTAEWIVERPGIPKTHPVQYFTLADYGKTIFTECNAASGTPNLYSEEQLQRARLIRMNVWDEPAHPGILVSAPARISATSFDVSYV
jgi:hypothetical protein